MRTMVQFAVGIVVASVLVASQVAEAQQTGGVRAKLAALEARVAALEAATTSCSTAMFSGTYAFTDLVAQVFQPRLFVNGTKGTLVLDGQGNGTAQVLVSQVGVDLQLASVLTSSFPQSFSFTYSVNSDCTGTFTSAQGSGTFTGVPGGAFAVTGIGPVELAVLIRQ